MTVVRVLALNILLGGRRGLPLDELVRSIAPDVVCVSEAPKRPLVSRRDCRRLTSRWGLDYVVGGRGAGDNMIAVAPWVEVVRGRELVLPTPILQPRRGVAVAQLRIRGRLLGVVGAHLTLQEGQRAAEVRAVLAEADRLRGPVVVAGDLNEGPQGAGWRDLVRAGYVDAGARDGTGEWLTFPADHPRRRIDALLVRGAPVLAHGDPGPPAALQAAASDHRGVLATLDV